MNDRFVRGWPQVNLPDNPTRVNPNRITLIAFAENREDEGGPSESLLPLSSWH